MAVFCNTIRLTPLQLETRLGGQFTWNLCEKALKGLTCLPTVGNLLATIGAARFGRVLGPK